MNHLLTQNTIKVGHFDGNTVPEELMMQYGHERWKCFDPKDPNVNMDNRRKVEFDNFDWQPHVRYIFISLTESGMAEKLVCAMRLIPTTCPYDLELDSWHYLTRHCSLPKDPAIIETGRWTGTSRKSRFGELYTGLMNREIYTWCHRHGYSKILGVIYTRFESMFLEQGVTLERLSQPYALNSRDEIIAMQITLDDKYIALANMQIVNGLANSDLKELGLRLPLAA